MKNQAIEQLQDENFVESIADSSLYNPSVLRAYPFSNEAMHQYIDLLNIKGGRVATVGSSGDQAFYSIYKDAESVTVLDLCPFAKPIIELKRAAIKNMTFDEFNEYWVSSKIFNKKYLKDLINDMDSDSRAFYKYVLRENGEQEFVKASRILKTSDMPILYNSEGAKIPYCYTHKYSMDFYRNEENYNQLKSKLKNAKIDYVLSGIENFHKHLKGEYTTIMLSNVFDYMFVGNSNAGDFMKIAKNLIDNNLQKNGTMQIKYEFYNTPFEDYAKKFLGAYDINSYLLWNYGSLRNNQPVDENFEVKDYPKTKDRERKVFEEDTVYICNK